MPALQKKFMPSPAKPNLGNTAQLCLRPRLALLPQLCSLQILKYIQYSGDFQTFI